MTYANNILELIGNTPLVRLNSVTEGIEATVLVKVEYLNPGGSVKDRIALKMIEDAEKAGKLAPAALWWSPPRATPASAWRSCPSSRATAPCS